MKTIETYREHIKQKLRVKNATEVIHHAVLWVESEVIRSIRSFNTIAET